MKRIFNLYCIVAVASVLSSYTHAQDKYALTHSEVELAYAQCMQEVYQRILGTIIDYYPTHAEVRSHKEVHTCVEDMVQDLTTKMKYPKFASFLESERGSKSQYFLDNPDAWKVS
jgi:hypothetical protein